MVETHSRPALSVLLQWAVVLVPAGWLLIAAAVVAVEPYDGYDTICNARHFLGQTPHYVDNRAPLMSVLLIPAVAAGDLCGLAPLDVRFCHLVSALLHGLFLVGTALFVRRAARDAATRIVCFAGGVLTVVFFAYGPFISHDLWPGLVLLVMVALATRLGTMAGAECRGGGETGPGTQDWAGGCAAFAGGRFSLTSPAAHCAALVVLGAASALVKQTYGVFWVCILVAAGIRALRERGEGRRAALRVLVLLAVCAACSALLYWCVMGAVLAANAPAVPWFVRPWRQLTAVSVQYAGSNVRFPWWVYVRNFPFYGLTVTVFIIPGLFEALRRPPSSASVDERPGLRGGDGLGSQFAAAAAWAWLCGFLVLHAVSFREVRYIAFLMPLSAILIARPVSRCLRDARRRWLVVVLLACDLGLAGREALRLAQPFYRENPAASFLSVLNTGSGSLRRPVFTHKSLSFLAPATPLFAGDRYHRLFHVGVHHVHILFRYGMGEVFKVARPEQLLGLAGEHPDSVLLYANLNLVNSDSLFPGPPVGIDRFVQVAGAAEILWDSDSAADGISARWQRASGEDSVQLILDGPGLGAMLGTHVFPCIVADTPGGPVVAPLQPVDNDRANAWLPADRIDPDTPPHLRIAAFSLLRRYHPRHSPDSAMP